MRNAADVHSYQFASTFEGVDFARIVREASEGTAFILVETRNRVSHKPTGWCLLAHTDALTTMSYKWQTNINGSDVAPYKAISRPGRVPGALRKFMEKVRQISNPRDTISTVTTCGNVND